MKPKSNKYVPRMPDNMTLIVEGLLDLIDI